MPCRKASPEPHSQEREPATVFLTRAMKKVLFLIFVLLLAFAAAWVIDRRIRADAEKRASTFITVHFIAIEETHDTLYPPPEG